MTSVFESHQRNECVKGLLRIRVKQKLAILNEVAFKFEQSLPLCNWCQVLLGVYDQTARSIKERKAAVLFISHIVDGLIQVNDAIRFVQRFDKFAFNIINKEDLVFLQTNVQIPVWSTCPHFSRQVFKAQGKVLERCPQHKVWQCVMLTFFCNFLDGQVVLMNHLLQLKISFRDD